MNDKLEALLKLGSTPSQYPPNSRYYATGTSTFTRPDGTTVACLRRRFLPQPEKLELVAEHTVREGDRLDNLAANYLGDPGLSWRLADANAAMHPGELTGLEGRRLRVTLPEGLPGSGNSRES